MALSTTSSTTFYAYRGSVARVVRAPDSMTVDLWSRTRGGWVPAPDILGYLTGAGGDPPADVLSRVDARRLLGLAAVS